MTKLTSSDQANQLQGKIPELAILRMTQLEGNDNRYDPDRHGFIVVLSEDENIVTDFPELGDQGLLSGTEDWPVFDYVEKFNDGTCDVFEAVTHLDNERVIAFIITDEEWLDSRLRKVLESYITPTLLNSPSTPEPDPS
jgi:hypothetical protein